MWVSLYAHVAVHVRSAGGERETGFRKKSKTRILHYSKKKSKYELAVGVEHTDIRDKKGKKGDVKGAPSNCFTETLFFSYIKDFHYDKGLRRKVLKDLYLPTCEEFLHYMNIDWLMWMSYY